MSYARVLTSRVASRSLLASTALVVVGAAVTALAAQWHVPMWPVPMTGQTLAVLVVGAALGWRRGAASQVVYLAMGAAGLPVFTDGAAGVSVLMGPTAGYLFAFPVAAALAGHLARKRHDRRFATMVLAFLAGSAVIYVGGVAGLMSTLDYSPIQAVRVGVVPFLIGDAIKAALAGVILPAAWRLSRD